MDIVFLIGRILFGGYFLMSGFNHFKNKAALTGYAESKKVPMPGASVVLTGIILVLAGLGVVLGVFPRIALILIVLFLVPTSFMMHKFWKEEGSARMSEQINFNKNLALAGAALALLMLDIPWVLSL